MTIPRKTPVRKMSARREAEFKTKGVRPFSTILGERKPVKARNAKRKASEFARCYGSRERVRWVKSRPCSAMFLENCAGPIDNAHVANDGTKGAGRRAGYECIAPLCRKHHQDFDQFRDPFDVAYVRAAMELFARSTARRWRLSQINDRHGLCGSGAREGGV